MHCTDSFYVVAVIGLRYKEFVRLDEKVTSRGLPISLNYAGHISDGSNCGCRAMEAARAADLVLWQPNGTRHLPAGFVPSLPVLRVHGVSSGFNALLRWLTGKAREQRM
jgi:hypothetical protein